MTITKQEYDFNRNVIVQPVGRGAAGRQDSVNLSYGFPATELLPVEALNQAALESLVRDRAQALHYTGGQGLDIIKNWQLRRLRKFGIQANDEHYLAVYGANQGIELTARVLINPGDTVWTEAATYFNAINMFRYAGAEIVGLPMDVNGVDVDKVEDELKRAAAGEGALPKFIYVMPNFQNPTGTTLPRARRERLAKLARIYNFYILEDDAYGELRFEGEDLPAIASYAPDRTIYLGTFSKTLGPGLRFGCVIAPREVADRMRCLTLNSATSPFTQEILGHLLQNYDYDAQIARLTACYEARRDALAEALGSTFGDEVRFQLPEGGFFLWLAFQEETDTLRLAELAAERGVQTVPGRGFFAADGSYPFIRLCFSYCGEREIEEGVRRLAAAYFDSRR
ncbi:2-aminoadipate transaminase [compost metagenome]